MLAIFGHVLINIHDMDFGNFIFLKFFENFEFFEFLKNLKHITIKYISSKVINIIFYSKKFLFFFRKILKKFLFQFFKIQNKQ